MKVDYKKGSCMKVNYKKHISWFLVFAIFFALVGCSSGGSQSNSKEIQTFSLTSPNGTVNGVITDHDIAVKVPFKQGLTEFVATFTTTGKSVAVGSTVQTSGTTPNDFSKPVVYTVTAENGTTATYTVTVTLPSSAKAIIEYFFGDTLGAIIGESISVTMPFGTDIKVLQAKFRTTGESVAVESTVQKSGTTPNDFSKPVVYTVTAENGTTATYTVNVTVAQNSAKAITAYSLGGVAGVITGESINVVVGNKTDVKALIATFTTTGESVAVGSIVQNSGTTPNDFSKPVQYTVHAQDGTTATYMVNVKVASNGKTILAYSINGVAGVITGESIVVTLSHLGTSLKALTATFTTTGESVAVESTVQTSGTTPNDFSKPVVYTLYAQDGTTATYTVTAQLRAYIGYYPAGCIVKNTADSVAGNCECIKDISTGNIWYVSNQSESYQAWCSNNSANHGYDTLCSTNWNKLNEFNNVPHCGIPAGGWHITKATSGRSGVGVLDANNPGGEWSYLYKVATAGTAPPGAAYANNGDLRAWMNNNGFNINNDSSFYWTTYSDHFSAVGVGASSSVVQYYYFKDNPTGFVVLKHD